MIEIIQALNPSHQIYTTDNYEFRKYGTLIQNLDFSVIIPIMEDLPVPTDTTVYYSNLLKTNESEIYNSLSQNYYGEMPIQIGFGGGCNHYLNGLEWHRGSEVIYALTDFIVILGSLQDFISQSIDSSQLEIFYIKKDQIIELYSTTLHLSPCNVSKDVFKMIVVLPKGTNTSLSLPPAKNSLLQNKNKWIFRHADATDGEFSNYPVCITGENIKILF